MGEKMNQKTIKILSIILIVVAIFCMTQPVLAANGSSLINNFNGNSAGTGANAGNEKIYDWDFMHGFCDFMCTSATILC